MTKLFVQVDNLIISVNDIVSIRELSSKDTEYYEGSRSVVCLSNGRHWITSFTIEQWKKELHLKDVD